MPLTNSQVHALRILLEDSEPSTVAAIDQQIASFSESDQRKLLETFREIERPRFSIPRPLESFHWKELEHSFADWAASPPGALDLEEGVLLVNAFGFPLEDPSSCSRELDEIAASLKRKLRGKAPPKELFKRVAGFLHEDLAFDGNVEDYYNPDNSYLSRILARKLGIPITLSLVYILLGQRVGLPIKGVGLPGHFIVRYETPEESIFLDPFDRGKTLQVEECAAIVRGLGYPFDMRFLNETPARLIVERMLNNLIGIYQRADDQDRAQQLTRYREIVHRG